MVKDPRVGQGGSRSKMIVEMRLGNQKDESQRWTKTKSLYLELRLLIQRRFRTTGFAPSWGALRLGWGTSKTSE